MGEVVLEAVGLVKTYGEGETAVPVLRGLGLTLSAGELVVILGPSGSGKSTLLNMLGLMDRPDQGEIRYSGVPTSRLDEEEQARLRSERIGFVFQFDALLPEFTILENITMPSRLASRESLEDAQARGLELLGHLGLKDIRDRFPYQVSGGERQRAALCRALINRPTVLLADEPTGNLDKRNGELVFKDLKAMAETSGAAVLMVTHNESARDYAARVLQMQDGVISLESERVKP
ncbi:MAG: ABC transporter ATP-binding protein [Elusimicrobia bacterium]|nr:ABC transporter ATP-binding protein [Elusimicrobiota bacterium]